METVRVHHPTLKGRYRDVPADSVEAHVKQGWKREPVMPDRDGRASAREQLDMPMLPGAPEGDEE